MEPDDLLCSRNARSKKPLARGKGTSRRASGGRVRKLRAVEGPSASIPEEVTSELGGIISSLVQRPQRKAIIRSENEMYDYKTRSLTVPVNYQGTTSIENQFMEPFSTEGTF